MELIDRAKDKRTQAILYFCKNTSARKLTKTKLFKLLYFLDFMHFKAAGRPVTDLEYYAWDYGPFPPKFQMEISNKKTPADYCIFEEKDPKTHEIVKFRIVTGKQPDMKVFSPREREILEQVAFIFHDASAKEMSEITHLRNTPWEKTLRQKGKKQKIDYLLALDDSKDSVPIDIAEDRLKEWHEMRDFLPTE